MKLLKSLFLFLIIIIAHHFSVISIVTRHIEESNLESVNSISASIASDPLIISVSIFWMFLLPLLASFFVFDERISFANRLSIFGVILLNFVYFQYQFISEIADLIALFVTAAYWVMGFFILEQKSRKAR